MMSSPLSTETVLKVLSEGELSLRGEFMWGSNYTYLAIASHPEIELQVVYKPTRGVRPLWDFPSATLARREAAAYVLSQSIGWDLVPPTVFRKNAPLGPGSIQVYIEHDPEYHYFNFTAEDRQRLRPVVAFDIIANNADRKGSHILIDPQRALWLIDHGLCFHEESKLRTVIWDFAGEQLPDTLCQALTGLQRQLSPEPDKPSPLRQKLQAFLSPAEIGALLQRTTRLLQQASFPNPDPSRRPYPWPPV
jgi:hypothetical protein